MKIIHMIDNYIILCIEAKKTGKYEAYKAYTQKYPYFFHMLLQKILSAISTRSLLTIGSNLKTERSQKPYTVENGSTVKTDLSFMGMIPFSSM